MTETPVCDECGEPLCQNCGSCHNQDCSKYTAPKPTCLAASEYWLVEAQSVPGERNALCSIITTCFT